MSKKVFQRTFISFTCIARVEKSTKTRKCYEKYKKKKKKNTIYPNR